MKHRNTFPGIGAALAAMLPLVVSLSQLPQAIGNSDEACALAVTTPLLCLVMAAPTFFVGRAVRKGWMSALAMFATALICYTVLAVSWTVWAWGAHQICR